MKIGIIGSGQIGGTLTRRLSALGHKVFVANSRGPESLKDLAAETGAKPVSVREAARSGELVVVTIPEKNISNLPADLFAGVPADVVVVDTGNYYPRQRDGRIDGIEGGMIGEPLGGAEARPARREGLQQYLCRASAEARQAGRGRRADRLAGCRRRWRGQGRRAAAHRRARIRRRRCRRAGRLLAAAAGDAGLYQGFRCRRCQAALAEARPDRTPDWRATEGSPGNFAKPT